MSLNHTMISSITAARLGTSSLISVGALCRSRRRLRRSPPCRARRLDLVHGLSRLDAARSVESILGLRIEGGALRLDPCIPRSWPRFEITLRHGTLRFEIVVENPQGVQRGVAAAELDGEKVAARPLSIRRRCCPSAASPAGLIRERSQDRAGPAVPTKVGLAAASGAFKLVAARVAMIPRSGANRRSVPERQVQTEWTGDDRRV